MGVKCSKPFSRRERKLTLGLVLGYLPNSRQTNRISFGAVPGDWQITMRAHTGTSCDSTLSAGGDSLSGQGLKDYCYFTSSPSYISSGDYFFRSKSLDSSTEAPTNGSLVNALIFEDGTKYGLQGLDEAAIAEAVWLPAAPSTLAICLRHLLMTYRSTRRSMEPFMRLSVSLGWFRSRTRYFPGLGCYSSGQYHNSGQYTRSTNISCGSTTSCILGKTVG
jgi:hypothetical protein